MTKYFEMASKSNLRWKSLTKKFWQNRIHTYFNVRKFQNEYIASNYPKDERNFLKTSALKFKGRIFSKILAHILDNSTLHTFILKFPDLKIGMNSIFPKFLC